MPDNTAIDIKEGTKVINSGAFSGKSNLISINIPDGVTSIGALSFDNCTSLTSINIPDGVTSIGVGAFRGCSSLTSINIPSSVTSIGSNAFSDTPWFSNQPDGVIYAGKVAYTYKGTMPNNTDIVIKEGIKEIAYGAFMNCSGLTSITLPNGVTSIANDAFSGCSNLTSITIPESVTSIGMFAFSGCSGLRSVTVESEIPLTISFDEVYSKRTYATLYVPAGSKAAYEAALFWQDFKEIVEIVSPSPTITFADANVKALCVANWDTDGDGELSEAEAAAVTNLGEVFEENTAITSFNELQYFTGLTSISRTFQGCSNLISVIIPDGVTNIGSNDNYGIPFKGAFTGCSSLLSVTIPNSVTLIGNKAFLDCTSLTSVDIPNSVTEICGKAFKNSGLISVTIPNSVTSIGSDCFSGCTNLTSVIIQGNVNSIPAQAFMDCTSLESVNIPNSVTSIGGNAFCNCPNLTSVVIPKNTTRIGNNAFKYTDLTYIVVEEGNSKYDSRGNCNAIIETATNTLIVGCQNTIIPNSITSLDGYAFELRTSLTSITIPESVTSIGSDCFSGCTNLTSVTLPESITRIEQCTFQSTGLISITIPNSVTRIDDNAFWNCPNLTSVIIPKNVTSIGERAFRFCNLTTVVMNCNSPITINENVFSNYDNATLYVPAGSKAAYEAADYWKEFKAIVEFPNPDVNQDGDVNVVDVVDIARFVVGTPPETFLEFLADLNKSGDVNVADAVVLVNEIAGDQNFVKGLKAPKAYNYDTCELELLQNSDNTLSFCMNGETDFTAFQFEMEVPEGIDISAMHLNGNRKRGHQLIYNKVSDGTYRVVALSLANNTFEGSEGELLGISLDGVPSDEICIHDIHFVNTGGMDFIFDALRLSGGSATAVQNLVIDTDKQEKLVIYDLQGRQLSKPQRGVNIVNGKKVIIR